MTYERTYKGRCVAIATLAIVSFFYSHFSFADTPTFNAIFFKPAPGRSQYLMLRNTQTLSQLQFDMGIVFNYAYRPLQILQGSTRLQGVIDHLLVGDFVASLGATKWLEFDVDIPFALYNRFGDPQNIPQLSMQTFKDFGDLRVEVKARVLDPWRFPVGLAIIPFLTTPTGKSSHYVGDSSLTGGLQIALDGRVHPKILLTFNTGYQGGRKVSVRNIEFQHLLLLGGGIHGALSRSFGVSAEVNTTTSLNKPFKDRNTNPSEALVSANWDVGDTGVSVFAGGGTCISCGAKGAKVRGVMGVKYRYNSSKYQTADAMNVIAYKAERGEAFSFYELKELKMNCPPNPDDFNPDKHDAACQKYYDLSEVADLVFRCPSKASDFDPKIHDTACPKVFDLADSYSQGDIMNIYELAVAEMSMLCPPNPGDFNPELHDLGCPKFYDLKEIAELSENCPKNAELYVEGRDNPSCPKLYELREEYSEMAWYALSDFDSEKYQLYDAEGIYGGEIKQLKPIYFDFAKSALRSDMMPALDDVVTFINKTPWIGRVRVGGNADAIGSVRANERIGGVRADAVVRYLKARGVREEVQFDTVSYGANRPAAPNTTAENRALNRRVIFIVTGWHAPRLLQ